MKTETTDVIFRKFPDGEVIALFPALPADCHLGHCLSYQSTGQHGAASVDLSRWTAPATETEFTPLKNELERIGYSLRICRRITQKQTNARQRAILRN